MPKRVRPGDVVEIQTRAGLAYVQYTHEHETFGALVRVLPGFHRSRPSDFGPTVRQKERFTVFFPLQAAISRGIVQIAGHEDVPDHARDFPLFRAAGNVDFRTGRVLDWWLWDGEREWRVGQLTPEQWQLPAREIWNDTMLVHRIEAGWTPDQDMRGRLTTTLTDGDAATPAGEHTGAARRADASVKHYLYFPSEEIAKRAAGKLAAEGYAVEVRLSGDENSWLVLALQSPISHPGEIQRVSEHLRRLAESLSGEYDGHEVSVKP